MINATAILVGDRLGGFATEPIGPFSRKIAFAFKENQADALVGNKLDEIEPAPRIPAPTHIAFVFKR